MKEFEIIDHTADIGIVAYGKTKREVFINAAKGMFEIIAGKNRDLKENFYAKIKLEAKSLMVRLKQKLEERKSTIFLLE
jgi:SHS2 domain-containing protein